MTSLNLKIYYLRTREKRMSQQAVADALGVRQATLSHLERGQSSPTSALLAMLCRYYDVTPTWLLDDERDVPPLPTERWQFRNGLVTSGMWVEVSRDAVVQLEGGKLLCPLQGDAAFYDDEAAVVRRSDQGAAAVSEAMAELMARRADLHKKLAAELAAEQHIHPRQRDASRRVTS